jgi:RNA recognition motif-containing protein
MRLSIFFTWRKRERSMDIYVGNIAYSASEEDLRAAFGEFGTVESVRIVTDRETGRSKGFGFVQMGEEDGAKAVENLDGKDMQGRPLKVNKARPKSDNRGGGGFRPRREGQGGGGNFRPRRDNNSGRGGRY